MSSFFSICLFVLAVLGHGYLWTDAVNRLHAWGAPRKWVDLCTLGSFAAFLLLPVVVLLQWDDLGLFASSQSQLGTNVVSWYVTFCALWGSYALLRNWSYEFLTDNPRVLVSLEQEQVNTSEIDRRSLFRPGFAHLLSKVPQNQVLKLTIDQKKLAIPNLSEHHEGLKIAHISDLHMTGRIGKQWYDLVVDQVNRLEADAVVITGDIVEQETCWPWLAETLGKLRAQCGVYFILGNHDFYIDTAQTKKLLEDCGLVCLSDRAAEREWNGAAVELAGNELPWGATPVGFPTSPKRGENGSPLRLALLHTPDQLSWACDSGAHLALAGHTHGGQLRFPILGPIISPSRNGTRYTCGVFQRDQTVLHVTRGITGKTPLRWNCPPEIALLELARA